MSTFSERIKTTRKLKELTQKQVADALEIKEQSYQVYEYGKRTPSIDIAIKLCNYFNVSADYLLGLSDDPERR